MLLLSSKVITMKLALLLLALIAYANCTFGLIAALLASRQQAPAPSHGPIIITSDYSSSGSSSPQIIPYPMYYPMYGYGK
jgi:hypothetical protein